MTFFDNLSALQKNLREYLRDRSGHLGTVPKGFDGAEGRFYRAALKMDEALKEVETLIGAEKLGQEE